MDIPNPERYRRSSIDNRGSISSKKLNKSIIDNYTTKLRQILRDPTLDPRFVAKILQELSESDINDFADYCSRKAKIPGHAFVRLCVKTMQYKTLEA